MSIITPLLLPLSPCFPCHTTGATASTPPTACWPISSCPHTTPTSTLMLTKATRRFTTRRCSTSLRIFKSSAIFLPTRFPTYNIPAAGTRRVTRNSGSTATTSLALTKPENSRVTTARRVTVRSVLRLSSRESGRSGTSSSLAKNTLTGITQRIWLIPQTIWLLTSMTVSSGGKLVFILMGSTLPTTVKMWTGMATTCTTFSKDRSRAT